MTVPARASKLDPYGEEILTLHRQGRKLAEISKHLAQTYGLSVALSTLSEYVNRPRGGSAPPTVEPAATPAQEMLLDQVEVYVEIQASIRVLVEEVQALRDAIPDLGRLEGRFDALSRQLEAAKAPASPAPLPGAAGGAKTPLPAPVSDAPSPALLRRIWARAFWVTGGLWLALLALGSYWLGVWDAPAP